MWAELKLVRLGRLLRGYAGSAGMLRRVASRGFLGCQVVRCSLYAGTGIISGVGAQIIFNDGANHESPFVESDTDVTFRYWLQTQGAEVACIRFGTGGLAGRGAFLASDCVPSVSEIAEENDRCQSSRCWSNQTLIQLPPELVLTAARVQQDLPGLRSLREETEQGRGALCKALGSGAASDAVLLGIWVLHARLMGDCEWAPYMQVLPELGSFDSPVHWELKPGSALELISGTPLGEAVQSKSQWLQRLHDVLPSALREHGMHELATAFELAKVPDENRRLADSLKLLAWADSVVWSRTVGIPNSTMSGAAELSRQFGDFTVTMALLPGIDMCNHTGSDNESAGWLVESDSPVAVVESPRVELRRVAGRDLGADREITISYGDKSAEEFLFLYGFFPPGGTPSDTVTLRLPAPAETVSPRLLELKARILAWLGDINFPEDASGEVSLGPILRPELPATADKLGSPRSPSPSLAAVVDIARVLVFEEPDCFENMGPARVGAWCEAGGGKFTAAVDSRALELIRMTVVAELDQLPADATQLPSDLSASEQRHLGLARGYVRRRRELLQNVLEWCNEAIAGVSESGVWWWA